jgi:transcriptional regulator with XRE-family HTH domain
VAAVTTRVRRVHPIVEALRMRRHQLRLSMDEVARRMGSGNRSSVCGWEGGLHEPGLTSAEQWATALGMELHLSERGRGRSDD